MDAEVEELKEALRQIWRDLDWYRATGGAMSNADASAIMRKINHSVISVFGLLYPPNPFDEAAIPDVKEPMDNNF